MRGFVEGKGHTGTYFLHFEISENLRSTTWVGQEKKQLLVPSVRNEVYSPEYF